MPCSAGHLAVQIDALLTFVTVGMQASTVAWKPAAIMRRRFGMTLASR
jgi:hypothetical protein